MLYNDFEMILFSLIYSDVQAGRFARPYLSHKNLYGIFNESLKQNINFFEIENLNELNNFFNKVVNNLKDSGQIREVDKYLDELKMYFIDNTLRFQSLKDKVKQELGICEANNIKYKTIFSNGYPKNFKELAEPPFVIYYKGYLPKDNELEKSLAVIGTRNPEDKFGKGVAERVGKLLTNTGWWNISGLAVGCDEFGHKGSLDAGGATGAILAHGLLQPIFPKENRELAEEILNMDGFLLSEIPPTVKITPLFLILRDRLQSGMTRGIFVVETSEKSGTLHTVKYALEQNKKVLVWDPSSIIELKDCKEINGNLILLNKRPGTLSPSVPKKYFKEIISIKTSEALKKYIDDLDKNSIKLPDKKIEEISLEQINLFNKI